MRGDGRGNFASLRFSRQTGQPQQHNTPVEAPLTKHELTEVLVCRQQNRAVAIGQLEHSFICDAWARFGDVQTFMPVTSEAIDGRRVHTLVGDEPQSVLFARG